MERHTGEPCAVKAASTVRRGAVGKVPKGNSLAAYPTIEQLSKHVEGPTILLWTGDNLDIVRGMNSESVDLIYLDPPFNSNRDYAAPIGSEAVAWNDLTKKTGSNESRGEGLHPLRSPNKIPSTPRSNPDRKKQCRLTLHSFRDTFWSLPRITRGEIQHRECLKRDIEMVQRSSWLAT